MQILEHLTRIARGRIVAQRGEAGDARGLRQVHLDPRLVPEVGNRTEQGLRQLQVRDLAVHDHVHAHRCPAQGLGCLGQRREVKRERRRNCVIARIDHGVAVARDRPVEDRGGHAQAHVHPVPRRVRGHRGGLGDRVDSRVAGRAQQHKRRDHRGSQTEACRDQAPPGRPGPGLPVETIGAHRRGLTDRCRDAAARGRDESGRGHGSTHSACIGRTGSAVSDRPRRSTLVLTESAPGHIED